MKRVAEWAAVVAIILALCFVVAWLDVRFQQSAINSHENRIIKLEDRIKQLARNDQYAREQIEMLHDLAADLCVRIRKLEEAK